MQLKLDPILKSETMELKRCFPCYVTQPETLHINNLTAGIYRVLLAFFVAIIKLRLNISGRSYRDYKDNELNNKEIKRIYSREAKTYEYKHHLTTNFRDTWWRRQTGLDVVSSVLSRNLKETQIHVLDVATGIGLSAEEMLRVFKLFEIKGKITAVDYNSEMLKRAEVVVVPRMAKQGLTLKGNREAEFFRADAKNLTKPTTSGLHTVKEGEFAAVTVLFGIGGIDDPVKAIGEFISVLEEGGILSITDIHRPYIGFHEQWPLLLRWGNPEAFSVMAWIAIIKPLILGTLWGWSDPTPSFYLPLLVVKEQGDSKYFGLNQRSISLNNEPWWFGLPVISTARVVFEKVSITKEEYENRKKLLLEVA